MENTSWLKQTTDKPLFPDVLWSRPENRRSAGKLLIIGGHQQSFNAVANAYAAAEKAGAGSIRVILPNKLQKTLSAVFPEAEFAPSNSIGSFSQKALASFIDSSSWADAVLLAGDFGRNSETAVLLETFSQKCPGRLGVCGDSVDYFLSNQNKILNREDTLVIANLSQLQKLAIPSLIQQNADFIKIIEQVSEWTDQIKAGVITVHSDKAIVALGDQISTTPVKANTELIELAAFATVWWLQQPENPFESLTTSTLDYITK